MFKTINFNNVPSEQRTQLEQARAEVADDINSLYIRNAFKHSIALTEEEMATVQSYFPRQLVFNDCSPNAKLRYSDHPVLSVLNEYANADASKYARVLASRGKVTLSIGDAHKSKVHASHNCLLVKDSREMSRHVGNLAGNTELTAVDLHNHCAYGAPTLQCVDGAENCFFNADVAFAVHSAYDISMRDLARIFDNHGLTQMIVYMHIPVMFYDKRLQEVDESRHGYKCHTIGDKVSFSMGDFATNYIHSYKTWHDWAHIAGVDAGSFGLVFEHTRVHGPMHIIVINKVAIKPMGITFRVPLSTIYSEINLVPSMSHYLASWGLKQSECLHYVVPAHVCNVLISYAIRTQDDGYRYNELATVASGLLRSIKIGPVVYADRWNVDISNYNDILMSIFFLGALMRRDRTQGIPKLFEEIKAWSGHNILYQARNTFLRLLTKFMPNYSAESFQVKEQSLETNVLWDYHIVQVKDHFSSQAVSVDITTPIVNVGSTVLPPPGLFAPSSPVQQTNAAPTTYLSSPADKPQVVTKTPLKDSASSGDQLELGKVNVAPISCSALPANWSVLRGAEIDVNDTPLLKHKIDFDDVEDLTLFTKRCSLTEEASKESQASVAPIVKDKVEEVENDQRCRVWLYDKASIEILNVNCVQEDITFLKCETVPQAVESVPDASENKIDNESVIVEKPTPKKDDSASTANAVSGERLQKKDKRLSFKFNNPKRWTAEFNNYQCAIESFYYACNMDNDIKAFKAYCFDIMQYRKTFTDEEIATYLDDGTNFRLISAPILTALIRETCCSATIVHCNESGNDAVVIAGKYPKGPKITIYSVNNSTGVHYTCLRPGGSKEKFPSLVKCIIEHNKTQMVNHVIKSCEVSCAPGYLSKLLSAQYDHKSYYYKPGLPLLKDFEAEPWTDNNDLRRLLLRDDPNLVVCDAARVLNSEEVINNVFNVIIRALPKRFALVIKTFANPDFLYIKRLSYMRSLSVDRVGTERYFYCVFDEGETDGLCAEISSELYHLDYTSHTIPFIRKDIETYYNEMCKGKFADICKGIDLNFDTKQTSTGVLCLTGYASASKTTRCKNDYPHALWIAPTKELSVKHNAMGVASYTPHIALRQVAKYDTVVVDELSQFPVEYFGLLRAIKKSLIIIAIGDIYQIPYVNYDSTRKRRTLRDFGVVNNLKTVYKIPHDICDAVNKVFKFDMKTQSEVKRGLYFADNLEQFKSTHPVIAYNDKTVKDLKTKGYNAHTITTFTGSRQKEVVLYIDGRSVLTKLRSQVEWVYVAYTRATDRLIIVGDNLENRNLGAKYINVASTLFQSYEEINQVRVKNDALVKDEEHEAKPKQGLVTSLDNKPFSPKVSSDAAVGILQNSIAAVNEGTVSHAFLEEDDMAEVKDGFLKTPVLSTTTPHRSFRSSKLFPEIALLKNQVSSDPRQTVQTLIKRYAKKLPAISAARAKIVTNDLILALARGVGLGVSEMLRSLRVSDDELMTHAVAYLQSLQDKMNFNPSAAADLTKDFDEAQEVLTFFMKRQSKFDPNQGFDASIKAGQGVAAMSKRVNILMAAYSRALLAKFSVLSHNRNIIFAVSGSDEQISDAYAAALRDVEVNDYKWATNDFSEWDSTFRTPLANVTTQLIRYMGCPEWLADWFSLYRKEWTMHYASKVGNTKLSGHEKQFSGNPFTICENTILNFALTHLVYDFKEPILQLFKGDDSAILCKTCAITNHGAEIIKITGHQLKPALSHYAEFAGYALTSTGFFPDVLRYAAKFVGKQFTDREHFEEVKQSVFARCQVVKTNTQVREGSIILAQIYSGLRDATIQNYRITPDQLTVLYDFIMNSDKIQFHELTEVKQPVLMR